MLSLASGINHSLNGLCFSSVQAAGLMDFFSANDSPGQDSYSAAFREEIKTPLQ